MILKDLLYLFESKQHFFFFPMLMLLKTGFSLELKVEKFSGWEKLNYHPFLMEKYICPFFPLVLAHHILQFIFSIQFTLNFVVCTHLGTFCVQFFFLNYLNIKDIGNGIKTIVAQVWKGRFFFFFLCKRKLKQSSSQKILYEWNKFYINCVNNIIWFLSLDLNHYQLQSNARKQSKRSHSKI